MTWHLGDVHGPVRSHVERDDATHGHVDPSRARCWCCRSPYGRAWRCPHRPDRVIRRRLDDIAHSGRCAARRSRPYRPWCDVDRTTGGRVGLLFQPRRTASGAGACGPELPGHRPAARPPVRAHGRPGGGHARRRQSVRRAVQRGRRVHQPAPVGDVARRRCSASSACRRTRSATSRRGRRPRRRRRQADRGVAARGDVHAPGAARRPRADRADGRAWPVSPGRRSPSSAAGGSGRSGTTSTTASCWPTPPGRSAGASPRRRDGTRHRRAATSGRRPAETAASIAPPRDEVPSLR